MCVCVCVCMCVCVCVCVCVFLCMLPMPLVPISVKSVVSRDTRIRTHTCRLTKKPTISSRLVKDRCQKVPRPGQTRANYMSPGQRSLSKSGAGPTTPAVLLRERQEDLAATADLSIGSTSMSSKPIRHGMTG